MSLDLIVSKCDYELLNDLCVDRTTETETDTETEAMAFCQLNNGRNSMEVKACILDAINDENAVNNNIMMNDSGLMQDTGDKPTESALLCFSFVNLLNLKSV